MTDDKAIEAARRAFWETYSSERGGNEAMRAALAAADKVRGCDEKAVLQRLKDRIDRIFNDVLCDMKPGWDDSMEGFNKAWGIARDILKEEIERAPR